MTPGGSVVDGSYNCITKTPFGDQESVFTVVSSGETFEGSNVGTQGTLEVSEGKVDANLLMWKMEMTAPMKITLEAEAIIEGDTLTGTVSAGAFGTMAMKGTRQK